MGLDHRKTAKRNGNGIGPVANCSIPKNVAHANNKQTKLAVLVSYCELTARNPRHRGCWQCWQTLYWLCLLESKRSTSPFNIVNSNCQQSSQSWELAVLENWLEWRLSKSQNINEKQKQTCGRVPTIKNWHGPRTRVKSHIYCPPVAKWHTQAASKPTWRSPFDIVSSNCKQFSQPWALAALATFSFESNCITSHKSNIEYKKTF